MIVEWNDRALASVERQTETYHSAGGYTRTKLTPSLVGMVYSDEQVHLWTCRTSRTVDG